MHQLIARTPIYLFIFTLVVITIMFYTSNTENYTNLTKANNRPKSVNVIISDMELIINNDQGSHQAKIVSNKVKHDPILNTTLLQNPILKINQQNETWDITAKTGTIVHNAKKPRQIEKIILSDQVKIVRKDLPKQHNQNNNNQSLSFFNLETSEITYLPTPDLIVTDKDVKITSKESVTTATGLRFDKKTQKLDLLSNVKSVYLTNKSNTPLKKKTQAHV